MAVKAKTLYLRVLNTVGSKLVSFKLNSFATTSAGLSMGEEKVLINGGGGTYPITYAMNLPAQNEAVINGSPLDVVFTFSWDSTAPTWDTNPMTAAEMTAMGLAFYDIDANSVGIGLSAGSVGYTGTATDIQIPSSVDGKRVTSIGTNAFYGCSGLASVIIPTSVTSIGSAAFSNCAGLTSITIPTSVTIIRNAAFSNCTGLASITIPTSVTSIGNYAFHSVPHIYYTGTATGSPWGATAIN